MRGRSSVLRALDIGSAVCYFGFCVALLVDEMASDVPKWLILCLFVAGSPSVVLGVTQARHAKRELTAHDVRVPPWLAFTPLGKIFVVGALAIGVGALCAAFGLGKWAAVAGVVVAGALWALLPRDPLPDPLDRPARSDEPPFREPPW